MNEIVKNYVRFFRDQKREVEREYSHVLDTPMNRLFHEGILNVGTIVDAKTKSGNIIIKIKKGYAPRLKMMKSFTIVSSKAKKELGTVITDWMIAFKQFHDGKGFRVGESDIMPLYFNKFGDNTYDYITCNSVDVDMFNFLAKALSEGKKPTALLYDPYPPLEYFDNLAYYTNSHMDNSDLLLMPKVDYDNWAPEELEYDKDAPNHISDTVKECLDEESISILQGPPGTGKSYTIASIIASYLKEGKTVCSTTMANSGLIELAKQKPLADALENKLIFKTSLKADEIKQAPGIQRANKDMSISNGCMLCTTFYKLSSLVGMNGDDDANGIYDLIVIEEASQAFLSTIAAFKGLGKKCLIVGDPMQLPPIVIGLDQKPEYKLWNADNQCNGMSAFAMGSNIKSFRIVTTFRLTPASAALSKVFYSNNFRSVKENYVSFDAINNEYFPKSGGVLFKFVPGFDDQNYNEDSIRLIDSLIRQIENNYPDYEIAIISPYRETVKKLQSEFQTDKRKIKSLTIETIDRIQGMTVDYAILYLPAGYMKFALDPRRFNVATSRSLSTTLIISDVQLEKLSKFKGKIRTFVTSCTYL